MKVWWKGNRNKWSKWSFGIINLFKPCFWLIALKFYASYLGFSFCLNYFFLKIFYYLAFHSLRVFPSHINWLANSKCSFSSNFILFSLFFPFASQRPRVLTLIFLFNKTLKAKKQMKNIARFSLFLLSLLLLIIFLQYKYLCLNTWTVHRYWKNWKLCKSNKGESH